METSRYRSLPRASERGPGRHKSDGIDFGSQSVGVDFCSQSRGVDFRSQSADVLCCSQSDGVDLSSQSEGFVLEFRFCLAGVRLRLGADGCKRSIIAPAQVVPESWLSTCAASSTLARGSSPGESGRPPPPSSCDDPQSARFPCNAQPPPIANPLCVLCQETKISPPPPDDAAADVSISKPILGSPPDRRKNAGPWLWLGPQKYPAIRTAVA